MSKLSFKNVAFTYHSLDGETHALENINFDVEQGELVSFVGPSGCGKTTILSLISGLLQPSHGEIYLDNNVINTQNKPNVGYMLQHDQLFPWRSIWKNILLGAEIKNKSKDKETINKAIDLIEKYGLSEFVKKYPNELSGGMRQRVALIRTLVMEPKLLLLDEPFSALDFQTRLKVAEDVHSIIKKENYTTIFITHDLSEAISISDKIFILSKRPAHIREVLDLFEFKNLSPLERRESPLFSQYFEQIWRCL